MDVVAWGHPGGVLIGNQGMWLFGSGEELKLEWGAESPVFGAIRNTG